MKPNTQDQKAKQAIRTPASPDFFIVSQISHIQGAPIMFVCLLANCNQSVIEFYLN